MVRLWRVKCIEMHFGIQMTCVFGIFVDLSEQSIENIIAVSALTTLLANFDNVKELIEH